MQNVGQAANAVVAAVRAVQVMKAVHEAEETGAVVAVAVVTARPCEMAGHGACPAISHGRAEWGLEGCVEFLF